MLTPADGVAVNPADPPVAVFTMHPEETAPISVVVVTPREGGEAEVMNVREPEKVYTAPLPPGSEAAQAATDPANEQRGAEPLITLAMASAEETAPPEQPWVVAEELITTVPDLTEDVGGELSETTVEEQTGANMAEAPWSDGSTAALSQPLEASLSMVASSPAYEGLQDRIASPLPIDAWEEEGLHFFVFQLHGTDSMGGSQAEAPVAVFTLRPDEAESISVVTVSPGQDGEEALITNVGAPEMSYTVPL